MITMDWRAKMRNLLRIRHDREYYWGLALLFVSSLTLVWALWRDAFKPDVFLVQVLLFSWGYALLWRNDLNAELKALRGEVAQLREQLSAMGSAEDGEAWAQELAETPDENTEAPALQDATDTPVASDGPDSATAGDALAPSEF